MQIVGVVFETTAYHVVAECEDLNDANAQLMAAHHNKLSKSAGTQASVIVTGRVDSVEAPK